MLSVKVIPSTYAADFAAIDSEPGLAAWVYPLRRAALSRFSELGFPTRRDEDWRTTNVAPIAEADFPLARPGTHGLSVEALGPLAFPGLEGPRLVFVNGAYAPALSSTGALPAGVRLGSLRDVLRSDPAAVEPYLARQVSFEHQPFVALNSAFLRDGAYVLIPQGCVLQTPVHLLFVSTAPDAAAVCHPRVLIVAGESSRSTVIESYAGVDDSAYFTNAVTEVVGAADSEMDHYKVQRESLRAFHVATMHVQLARSCRFSSHSIALGGSIARSEVNAVLAGEGIECTLNGLAMASGRQLIASQTSIDHAMPHCNSHEVYKNILDGHARGVFNGKIYVRPDAQKTDAKQTNQTLLLSEDATINTKPQLEIYADDVKCTHGATVGQLDAEALFYLRSRGIGASDARSLLTYAFAADIVRRIRVDAVRAQLDEGLFQRRMQGGT